MREISIDVTTGDVTALYIPVTTVDVELLTGGSALYGWSLRETTGAAVATAEILDGGQSLGEIALAAGGISNAWFGPMGIEVRSQILLHVIAGSITGAVYAGFSR